jgi:hypothetical protein
MAPGISSQCGRRSGDAQEQGDPNGGADEGKRVGDLVVANVDDDVDDDCRQQDGGDDGDANPIHDHVRRSFPGNRRIAMLLQRGRNAEDDHRESGCRVRLEDLQRADAVDPHHRRGRVAHDAPRPAGVRRGDNRREVADVDPAAEHHAGDRPADECGGNVIEEARQHENHDQEDEAALPVARQEARENGRYATCLEVLRQEREAQQQAEQVGEQHPFMGEMRDEARGAGALRKGGEQDLEQRNHRESDRRHPQRVEVKQGDPQKRQPEQMKSIGMPAMPGGSGRPGTAAAAPMAPRPVANPVKIRVMCSAGPAGVLTASASWLGLSGRDGLAARAFGSLSWALPWGAAVRCMVTRIVTA